MNANRYAAISAWFHWISAALILVQFWLGFTFHDFPRQSAERALYFGWHKTVGVVLLLLVLARLINRFLVPPPAMPKGSPRGEKLLANVTHWSLYALLLLLPVTALMHLGGRAKDGMVDLNWGLRFPALPGEAATGLDLGHVHEFLAKVMIGLLVLHVLAALYHQVRRDRAAGRMWPFR